MAKKLRPVHLGEIMREEFIEPLGLNPHKVAVALRVSAPTVYEITREERSVSSEIALRLACYFKTTPEFWLSLQSRYDLEITRDEDEARVRQEVQPVNTVSDQH